jgi:hypothetical protein
MKKNIFMLAFAFIGFSALSQPLANHLYFGGSLGFQTFSAERNDGGVITQENDQSSFSFNPAIGYTLTDNWLVGLRFGISSSQTENVNQSGSFDAELFARYNIPIVERFYFFPEFQVGFGSTYTDAQTPTGEVRVNEGNSFTVGVAPGFAFFPSTHWSIELSAGFLGFVSTTNNDPSSDPQPDERTTNQFGLSLNPANVNVGVSYYLQLN